MQAIKIYSIGLLIFMAGICFAQHPVSVQPAVEGIRIAWDYNTLTKVSSNTAGRYSGYARLIQLADQSLFCVYEADGNIVAVKSYDTGKTWSAQIMIAPRADHVNMSAPDILQLKDRSILVCYNPRPQRGSDTSKHFAIKTTKSYDGGQTWTDERTLYRADYRFENGCWEPSVIQLSDGQLQLFFANEGVYLKSNEQNISMVRSTDGGLRWSARPRIVSFRPHSRDGMPVPVLLQNGKEIVCAIEDNGFKNFKPYIIRSTVKNDWLATVGASDPNRHYALAEPIPDSIYAGAPYLRQLKTGETILSYQGTEGRINNMNHSEMKVVIGDNRAMDFNRKTVPFHIAPGKSGLWNSLSVLNDSSVVALTSTGSFNDGHRAEVWMIRGYIIPELSIKKGKIDIDGMEKENVWKGDMPVFIGHEGPANLEAGFVYDDNYLYLFTQVNKGADGSSAIGLYLDPQNKSYDAPAKGVYKLNISADNKLAVFDGDKGEWAIQKSTGIKSVAIIKVDDYVVEAAIPWAMLGGRPSINKRIGYNISLTANTGYTENIAANEADKPFTWSTLKLH
ncbi:sugar-binding protein [Mucilaginibacter sp. UR6-11]|uniref:sugar-binding protein n=1 Tax=Mucilaginibacter sp. UR6-11 TaxID=1435644 RepID=UPI001E38F04B|nr:sugar-binding protein [Mucilaginibacter sp. UR6-11]MCC8425367.1 exo-alpha-sialidase [Mucilaginibacter sp. UR6-11]